MKSIRLGVLAAISALVGASSIRIPLGFLWIPGLAFAVLLLLPLGIKTIPRGIACLVCCPIAGAVSAIVPVVFDFVGESAATQNHGIWIFATTLSGGVGGLLVAIPACAELKWRALSRCGSVAMFGAAGGLLFGSSMSILPEILPWFLSIVVALFSWQLLVAAKLAAILAKDTDVPKGG